MLREVTSASNDGACLDAAEYLGAEFDDASPEVRAAVALRSRHLPKPDMVRAAWSRLSAGVRDQIGETALLHHFYALVHQRPNQGLSLDAGNQAARAADIASEAMDRLTIAALPILYGTDVSEPAWAQADLSLALALQIGTAAEAELQTDAIEPVGDLSPCKAAVELHMLALPEELAGLSPVQSVIALHRACWGALQASAESLKARGEWEWRSVLSWPAEEAEDEALTDCLMTSCRDRADAAAMASHLSWYLQTFPHHPRRSAMGEADAALIAVRLRDLSMILGRDLADAASTPVPGAMAERLSEHRAVWTNYRASPDAAVRGSVQRVTLIEGLDEAAEAVLLAPCADRAEAAAFVEHVGWLWAELEEAGDDLASGFGYEAKQLRTRAGDLAVWIGDSLAPAASPARSAG